jgi:hypothetical protein
MREIANLKTSLAAALDHNYKLEVELSELK